MKLDLINSKIVSRLGKTFLTALSIFLYLSVLNYSSYVVDCHDCSNMATEQYLILNSLGFDVRVACGDNHAWLNVNGYEYDPVSFLPMSIWNMFGYREIDNPRYYYLTNDNIETLEEWMPRPVYYIYSIPILLILIIINILRITVIRQVMNNGYKTT